VRWARLSLELILESSHLKFHLVELVLKLHGLLFIFTQLFLQIPYLGISRLRILLPTILLKLKSTYQLLSFLLRLHQLHSLSFKCLVLPL